MSSKLTKNSKKKAILFDLISTQGTINGGAEFTVKILYTILERHDPAKHEIIFLFDSKIPAPYDIAMPEFLQKNYKCTCVDIAGNKSISNIITEYNIDLFFIGIGQRLENYSLNKIDCKTFIVFHDLSNIEIEDNQLDYFVYSKSIFNTFIHLFISSIKNIFLNTKSIKYKKPFEFALKENVTVFTVSEYSKISLKYYFPSITKDIMVIHSPEKLVIFDKEISNKYLNDLINSRANYFLILGADRPMKNVNFALNVFEKFSNLFPEYKIVTIGKQNSQFPNHLGLPYLSASDLEHAFINSYCLIYSTLFEGYGYPPIEAMKYGKPVIASNVCSIPEILADSPIYFSPFYKIDLMKALMKVTTEYKFYCKKSILRYREIQELQSCSNEKLVKMILN